MEKSNSNQVPLLEQEIPKIDSILNEAGYSKKTWKIIFLSGFYIFSEGSQLTLISSLFVPLKEFYNLTDSDLSFASSLMFIGVALGSILSNFFSIIMSRRSNLVFFMGIVSISNLIVGLFESFMLFTIFRFIIGFALGIMLPMIFGILTEYLPSSNRGFTLMSIWLFFGFGGLYVNTTMLILMPNLEPVELNSVIFILSFPFILFTIAYYFYLEESPRKLILIDEIEEGFEILETIKNEKINENDRKIIIEQIKGGINKELKHELKSVFHKKFRKTTIIQSYIWVCFSYIFYGGIFSIGLLLDKIGFMQGNLITKTMMVYGLSMPGNIIGGILTENKHLGRLKTCQIGYGFLTFFLIFVPFFQDKLDIFIGILGLFLNISFNVTSTYCSEIYPTQIRDTALGYFYFLTRVSAFLSQYISLAIISYDYRYQYVMILFMSFTSFIFVFMLPIEPMNMSLDFYSSDEESDYRSPDLNKKTLEK